MARSVGSHGTFMGSPVHVQWQPMARSVAAQCTFSGSPWHVQWLPSARSVAVRCTFSGCPVHVQWPPSARSVAAQCTFSGSPLYVAPNMFSFVVLRGLNRFFVIFHLVWSILTCYNITSPTNPVSGNFNIFLYLSVFYR